MLRTIDKEITYSYNRNGSCIKVKNNSSFYLPINAI
jgi:hypothetical protein